MKFVEAVPLVLLFEPIAGFLHQVGDVDNGQRIGARHNQQTAGRHAAQGVPRAQRGQRTFEAAQIEGC